MLLSFARRLRRAQFQGEQEMSDGAATPLPESDDDGSLRAARAEISRETRP